MNLGPQTALLLGMLGGPMTTAELHSLTVQAFESDETAEIISEARELLSMRDVTETSPMVWLHTLAEGGVPGIAYRLERLEEFSLVQRATMVGESLWWRT
jgi:hypothetical protein